ncbi:TPA: hypothetical protein N0F65_011264 [Lagenidium giganteum]|uniref:RanBP-type and C3HC4-type zinc finger-containing protein 1 n=1 Tax=Lagenidium giganteum TaxID=4803 RepID=A0AAV2YZY2_9STRA|nr:TPA: hypothetical protein N0F65_011264 [Lagenidium giganteum]
MAWSCALCTYENEDASADACAICMNERKVPVIHVIDDELSESQQLSRKSPAKKRKGAVQALLVGVGSSREQEAKRLQKKLAQLRELGIDLPANDMIALLARNCYCVPAAASEFFEKQLLESAQTTTSVTKEEENASENAMELFGAMFGRATYRLVGLLVATGTANRSGVSIQSNAMLQLQAEDAGRKRSLSGSSVAGAVRILTSDGSQIGRLDRELEVLLHGLMKEGLCKVGAFVLSESGSLAIFSSFQIKLLLYVHKDAFDAFEDEHQHFRLSDALFQLLELVRAGNASLAVSRRDTVSEEDADDVETFLSSFAGVSSIEEGSENDPADRVVPHLRDVTLREHQRQALRWMAWRENQDAATPAAAETSPLWDEREFTCGGKYFVSSFERRASLKVPEPPQPCRGGILADEMGMGKTLMMLSLVVFHKFYRTNNQGKTLIVCPLSLLHQWKAEIQDRFIKRTLQVIVYYGDERSVDAQELAASDVVLTTYGVLSSEVEKPTGRTLFSTTWARVILDEAHSIKNRSTGWFRACSALDATYRWCLTGTPIQNSLEDVYSLIAFLRYEPWSRMAYWKRIVSAPYEQGDNASALAKLKIILSPVLLRRTKQSRDASGKNIVSLPPKYVETVSLQFSPEERAFYQAVYSKSRAEFNGYAARGQVSSSYAAIFALLLRLRQACDHPFLVLGKDIEQAKTQSSATSTVLHGAAFAPERHETMEAYFRRISTTLQTEMANTANQLADDDVSTKSSGLTESYISNVLSQIEAEGIESQECPICLDPPVEGVLTPCAHVLCSKCLKDSLAQDDEKACPVCRTPVDTKKLFALPELTQANTSLEPESSSDGATDNPDGGFLSTKMRQLLMDMKALRLEEAAPSAVVPRKRKVVIFSQWTHMLEMVAAMLQRHGFSSRIFHGGLTQEARERVLHEFSVDTKVDALVISLRAGGVGLNLTCASVVFLMDPWWNPGVEEQAIDRVHRLGQQEAVLVKRYVVEDSVEDMILQLQKRKENLVKRALVVSTAYDDKRQNGLQLEEIHAAAAQFHESLLVGRKDPSKTGGNPHVRAIQSRVDDLVRRFDESMNEASDVNDEDSDRVDVPTHWRVGDVLMSTHNALAKTGSRMERTILTEFIDDFEVNDVLDGSEYRFSQVIQDMAHRADMVRDVFAKTVQMMRQLQLSDEAMRLGDAELAGDTATRMRNLKITIDALHKEKAMVLAQLHEQTRTHKEVMGLMDEQNQELKKVQIAMGMKQDEMKQLKDECAAKQAELQRQLDGAQQNIGVWRDKFQASLKANLLTEQRIVDVERRNQQQTDEITKLDVLIQARQQEIEKLREKYRESELSRQRAEEHLQAAHMQTLSTHSTPVPPPKAEIRTVVKTDDHTKDILAREKHELEIRAKMYEANLTEMEFQLRDANDTMRKFENDNRELTRIVRELRDKARDQAIMTNNNLVTTLRKSSSFAVRPRKSTAVPASSTAPSEPEPHTIREDDLSTASSDEDSESEREEQELSAKVREVVTSVFPDLPPVAEEAADTLEAKIAHYENPETTPMKEITPREDVPPPVPAVSVVPTAMEYNSIALVPATDLETLRAAYETELQRVKKQYVEGLVEYKRLVIEQYERRQHEVHSRHRSEIENLILLVQDKFRMQIQRRGQQMERAKESLKQVCRAMRMEEQRPSRSAGATRAAILDANGLALGLPPPPQVADEDVPLKLLLRAAVFAMSTSKTRNTQGEEQIRSIIDNAKKAGRARRRQQLKADNKPVDELPELARLIPLLKDEKNREAAKQAVAMLHVGCQVEEVDFEIFRLKGLRDRQVSPECLDDYVLDSVPLSPGRHASPRSGTESHGNDRREWFDVREGAMFADGVLDELRRVLPSLPPGKYFVSPALRKRLLLELLRFFSSIEAPRTTARNMRAVSPPRPASPVHDQPEFSIGSPRDTPFMRRKAVDAVAKSRIHRQRLLAQGGTAVVHQATERTMYANNVSNLDQILSSLQCYMQSARVRSDVYNLLRQIPSLQPNCGNFTHNDGTTSTLLHLTGTIPIFYRQNQYNIPVEFWMVEAYPLSPPVCFVRPTADMMIKPGHPHVTNEGYVLIQYTSEWRQDYTLVEMVAHLCSIFGNMPPVFRRPSQPAPQYGAASYSSSTSSFSQPSQQQPAQSYYQSDSYSGAQQQQQPQQYPYGAYTQSTTSTAASSYGHQEPEGGLFGQKSTNPYSLQYGSAISATRLEDPITKLKAEVTAKIQRTMEDMNKRIRDDIDMQFEHQLQLTQSKDNVERGIESLRKLRSDLQQAKESMAAQDAETAKWLEDNEAKDTVDPDTILVESDPLSKQMIDALADHQTIEDALYFMDRALSNGEIELSVFLKEVRKLSRKQFMCQAIVVKVHETQTQFYETLLRGVARSRWHSNGSVKIHKSKLSQAGPGLADFIRESRDGDAHDHHHQAMSSDPSQMSFPMHESVRSLEELEAAANAERSFYIETYGCQMNSADSEIVRAILLEDGYQPAPAPENADIVLLNTCAVRENAESKIWNRLEHFRQTKAKIIARSKKNAPKQLPTVGVLGCMAERLKTKLLESDKMVDLVVGPDAYRDIPNLLRVVRGGEAAVNVQLSLDETYADIAPVRSDPDSPSAFVSIMRGCNNMCSYCIVPFTRGRERSRVVASIVDEVRALSDQGVKEVVLLGQNVNSYHDRKSEGAAEHGRGYVAADGFNNMFRARDALGYRFVDLLDQVSLVDPEMRIRFTSPHPKDFPNEVFDLVRERHNICKSFHMPAQSGSSSALQRMRRGYTREAYLSLVDNMRSRIPGVAISSDFISGFCGETEEEHADTLSLMRQVCYDQAFMFAYSVRAGTHAAHRMEDDVPQDVKLRRLQEVIDTYSEVITRKNMVEDSDRLHVVLVQGPSRRSTPEAPKLTGLTDTSKRCVFTDVAVPSSLREYQNVAGPVAGDFVPLPANSSGVRAQRGDYVLVRVHEAGRHTLHATPVARTTLQELAATVPSELLGARPFSLEALGL